MPAAPAGGTQACSRGGSSKGGQGPSGRLVFSSLQSCNKMAKSSIGSPFDQFYCLFPLPHEGKVDKWLIINLSIFHLKTLKF